MSAAPSATMSVPALALALVPLPAVPRVVSHHQVKARMQRVPSLASYGWCWSTSHLDEVRTPALHYRTCFALCKMH